MAIAPEGIGACASNRLAVSEPPTPPTPVPQPSPPSPEPPVSFPSWLRPLVRILLTLIFAGGYIVLFAIGLYLGWRKNGQGGWPTANEDAQAAISAVGGIAATLFAVALNLPRDKPLGERAAYTLGLVRLRRDWDGWDRKVLVVFGTALVICYVPFSLIGFVETIARATKDVPGFIANFAGPGLGILLTAFIISAARLTNPPR